jgi:hypothetical protein
MWQVKLVVDFNGIVLFDPDVVVEEFGKIRRGTNLFKRFTTTDDGDRALATGAFVPVLGIDDSDYEIYVRFDSEPSLVPEELVLCTSGAFALRVKHALVIADLEALQYWNGSSDGNRLQFSRGTYAVNIRGFSSAGLKRAGYEFILSRKKKLPKITGHTGARMRVLRLP